MRVIGQKNEMKHMKFIVHIGRLLCKVSLVSLCNRGLRTEILHNGIPRYETLHYEVLRHEILRQEILCYSILRYDILLVQGMNFVHTGEGKQSCGESTIFYSDYFFRFLDKI